MEPGSKGSGNDETQDVSLGAGVGDPAAAVVVRALRVMEKALNSVLKDAWEGGGTRVVEGADIAPTAVALAPLLDTDQFREHFSVPRREITEAINVEVFGAAPVEAKELLARFEGEKAKKADQADQVALAE
jgi:hypothetical protein